MKTLTLALALGCSGMLLHADDTAQERLKDATDVLHEVMATPDKGIPQDLLDKAHCAVIVPGVKKAAFGIGGKFGKGFAVCRRNGGEWGAPAAVRIEGGSFGFQIGVSNTDVVMLVMNERGMRRLLEDKFTLGADAAVAGGPVGRSAQAETDAQLRADILSWSRSKGLFAGISLEGATLRSDSDADKELYGKAVPRKDILLTNNVTIPAAAHPLVAELDRVSPHEAKSQPVESRVSGTDKTKGTGEANRAKDKDKDK